jgi:hypothetical protein
MNKKMKSGIIAIIVIVVVLCAGIGCFAWYQNKKNNQTTDSSVTTIDESKLTTPILELTSGDAFIQPTDDFDYASYVSKATTEADESISLVGTEYLTWETYDFSKADTYHDVKYILTFPNGESVTKYLHVQVQYPDGEAPTSTTDTSSEQQEGDRSDATASDPYREYRSYNLKNGMYKGTGTGEYVLADKDFLIEDYGDQIKAFEACKEYCDSSAGRYFIFEKIDSDTMFLIGYDTCFLDADIYPYKDKDTTLIATIDNGMKELWENFENADGD